MASRSAKKSTKSTKKASAAKKILTKRDPSPSMVLKKVTISVRQRTLWLGQNGNQQIGNQRSLPILQQMEALYPKYTKNSRS